MLLDVKNLPMVAMDFMNEVHMEDVEIINSLFDSILEYEQNPNDTNENNITTQYQNWIEHTIEHFRGEEVQMVEKNFPPYPMHKGEHERCLETMYQVFENWKATKDIQNLKVYFTQELPNWLINHIQTMDTVTAMFFKTGLSPCSMR